MASAVQRPAGHRGRGGDCDGDGGGGSGEICRRRAGRRGLSSVGEGERGGGRGEERGGDEESGGCGAGRGEGSRRLLSVLSAVASTHGAKEGTSQLWLAGDDGSDDTAEACNANDHMRCVR